VRGSFDKNEIEALAGMSDDLNTVSKPARKCGCD
jgi:hypothetical protein